MKNKLFRVIVIIFICIFVCTYVVANTGYYEYNLGKKTIITNEKIKEFEEAVKNNKNIDELEYFKEEEVNYSNKFTNFVYNISDRSNKIARKIAKSLFKKMGSLIEED